MPREYKYKDEDGKEVFVVQIDIEEPELACVIKEALAPHIPDYMQHDDEGIELLRQYLLGNLPDRYDPKSPFYGDVWFQLAEGIASVSNAKKSDYYKSLFESFPHWLPHGHRTPAMTGHPQDRYVVGVVYPQEFVKDAGTVLYGVCYFNSGNPPYDPAESSADATARMDPYTLQLIAESNNV